MYQHAYFRLSLCHSRFDYAHHIVPMIFGSASNGSTMTTLMGIVNDTTCEAESIVGLERSGISSN